MPDRDLELEKLQDKIVGKVVRLLNGGRQYGGGHAVGIATAVKRNSYNTEEFIVTYAEGQEWYFGAGSWSLEIYGGEVIGAQR